MTQKAMSGRGLSPVIGLVLLLVSCSGGQAPGTETGHGKEAWPVELVSLDQGWTHDEAEAFWFTSQGSQVMPYDWFLVLEQASGEELFRRPENMDRFGYIPVPSSARNPAGLPIGFTKDVDAAGEAWLGFTCAACHTGQVDYAGKSIVIEGGQALADYPAFDEALLAALNVTATNAKKLDRFARALLGDAVSAAQADELRSALLQRAETMARRAEMNATSVVYGNGRVDAFGQILNQVTSHDLEIPDNRRDADAPVSYPFLWDTPQADFVQWNGANANAGMGPWIRNVGEVLGVFGTVSIDPTASPPGYDSSANMPHLGQLEDWLRELQSPLWPEHVLPSIDQAKAVRGRVHYDKYCVACHANIDRSDPKREVKSFMVPVDKIGTDPKMAANVVNWQVRQVRTGRLEGTPSSGALGGDPFGPTAGGVDILANAVIGAIVKNPPAGQDLMKLATEYKTATFIRSQTKGYTPLAYKARPLNGIWATAPYLHNGSVPSLWQLLQPAEARDATFHVGSREFDPADVGYESGPSPRGFLFDTSISGNSNAGHVYGTSSSQLSVEQKRELLEYLKTL